MREMKDSGIEWIGNIPASWIKNPIKNIVIQRDGGAWGDEPYDDTVGTICMRIADFDYSTGKFKDTSTDDLTKRMYSDAQIYNLQLKKGDILIEKSGGGEKTPVGRTVIFDKNYVALFANFMDRIRVNTEVISEVYTEYWLRVLYVCKVTPFYINQTTGIQNLDLTLLLAKEKIYFPSKPEQLKITDFLDTKCGEIDSLIENIQTQINTLQQYKRSIITEAVTKGLNSNAEMKDSGVQWIGKVPKSWKVDKLKYHLHRNEPRNPGDKTVLSLYRDYGVVIKDSRDDNHNVTSEDTSNYKYVRPGDFVINKMKAWQGSVAVSKYEGIVSPAYFVYEFTDDELYKPYFHYLLRSCYQEEFRRLSGGIRVGQWDLPSTALDNTLVLLPPLDEQKSIANYLNMQCSEIDKVIADKNEQLATIDEYKKSLIYEYVTGKKEVPTA